MALIKPSAGITDISGKVDGVYFSRDDSGLHIRKNPRVITRKESESNSNQKNFYGNLKREENPRSRDGMTKLVNGQPPYEEQTDPKSPNTAQIFQLRKMYGVRQYSLVNPELTGPDEADMWFQRLRLRALDEFIGNPVWRKFFFTQNELFCLMKRFYMISKYTWGVIPEESYWDTLTYIRKMAGILEFCARNPIIRQMFFTTPFLLVFAVQLYLAKTAGWTEFQKGRVLIKTKNGLWWGQLIARPTPKMLDFYVISPALAYCWLWEANHTEEPYRIDYLYLGELPQTVLRAIVGWGVYNWDKVSSVFRGYAFRASNLIYRMESTEAELRYWGVDVGWRETDLAKLNYPLLIEQYFSTSGWPQPPL